MNSNRLDDVVRFRDHLDEETDRGAVLVAIAYLDGSLVQLLEARFVAEKKSTRTLLRDGGPLGSFSSRIDLAYCLGLISDAVKRDLHSVRKIRNMCAHQADPISLEHEKLAVRCSQLRTDGFQEPLSPRRKFIRVVLFLLAHIHAMTETVSHMPSMFEVDFGSPEVRKHFDELLARIDKDLRDAPSS